MSAQLTEEQRAATPCHVALCPECKTIVACAVIQPELRKDNAKTVASWVRDDLTVTTLPVSEVRAATWGHVDGCKFETLARQQKAARRKTSAGGKP